MRSEQDVRDQLKTLERVDAEIPEMRCERAHLDRYDEPAVELEHFRIVLYLLHEAREWAQEGWRAAGPNRDDLRALLPWHGLSDDEDERLEEKLGARMPCDDCCDAMLRDIARVEGAQTALAWAIDDSHQPPLDAPGVLATQ